MFESGLPLLILIANTFLSESTEQLGSPKNAERAAIDSRDGEDPQFSDRLQQLSAVNLPQHFQGQARAQGPRYAPAPENPLVNALASRAQVTQEADRNLGDAGALRRYVHPQTITAILEAREVQGDSARQIEMDFRLAEGVLDKLGPQLRRPTAKRVEPKTVVNQGAEARKAKRAMDMDSDMDGEMKR